MSNWEEFGKESWSVMLGISGEMGLGCSEGFLANSGGFWVDFGHGRKGYVARCLVAWSV